MQEKEQWRESAGAGASHLGSESTDGIDEDALLGDRPLEPMEWKRDLRLPLDRVLDCRGGIVATHEFLAAGVDRMSIRVAVERRRLVRLRKGWYGRPDLPPRAALAWAIGGPLACVSALVHHGALADLFDRDEPLHVAVRANTSRRPSRLTIASYPGGCTTAPVRHWSSTAFRSGNRAAVDVETALEQLRHCRPLLARRLSTA